VASPGERLIADVEAVLAREIGKLGQVMRRARGIVDRLFRDVRAQAKQSRPQFVHEVEFARRPLEIARADRIGHRLEIAHRLQGDDLEAEIGGHRPRLAWFAAEKGQVIFKDFDSAKARLGGGRELGLECATHAHRGDRPSEHWRKSPILSRK
jgi:hypothetical protein